MLETRPMSRPSNAAAATVIVVSYQTRDLLRTCLSSLRRDAESGLAEVVVVDNCSSDGSPQMVSHEFPWSTLIASSTNLGFGAAVNLAARDTTTPWLVAANADTEVAPGALPTLLDVAGQYPATAVFAPRLELPNGETQRSSYRFPRMSDRFLAVTGAHRLSNSAAARLEFGPTWSTTSRQVDWAMGAFLLFRRLPFESVGGFDESQWMYSEDLDICWRLAQCHWEARYVAEATVRHTGEGAAKVAFGGKSDTLKLAAHYAWLEDRRGWPTMVADAAIQLVGASVRLGLLWLFGRCSPRRWHDRRDRVRRWRDMNLEALRIRGTVRRQRSDNAVGSDSAAR